MDSINTQEDLLLALENDDSLSAVSEEICVYKGPVQILEKYHKISTVNTELDTENGFLHVEKPPEPKKFEKF